VAIIQPGPTFDQGTSAIAASTPFATAGAVGAAADVVGLGLGVPDALIAVVEPGVDVHAATSIAATATAATCLRPEFVVM
jgi:hypothetical protein